MLKAKKIKTSFLFGLIAVFAISLGIAFSAKPMQKAEAQSLGTANWTFVREGDSEFRIQNGNAYWNTYTNSVTTASMLDYTEINGKTLSEINAKAPGAITVTLQPAGGSIGSFYRVSINTEKAGFTVNDIGTVVVRAGWSHTDANATYTIDTDLYFAHAQNKWTSDNNNWKYIPATNVVDISDAIQLEDQGIQPNMTNTRAILIKTSNNNYWTGDPITPNEGGGSFLNMLYINGTSVREWNKQAHAKLNAGEITDISYGSDFWLIDNGPDYAPIAMSNSSYIEGLGSISQVWIPTNYISNVSSFKVAKGFANLQGDTLYYVSKDVEYVKVGFGFRKIASAVDISDAFKILAQDYTSSNGTMLYYLHTNNVQYWTAQYDSTGAYAINENEWKGESDASLQGGAVQMSYIEFNGESIYDINAQDNGAYGATQGNIASGGKYAPILAFLTPQEVGNAIKLQVPTAFPSGSGVAKDNHKTITIKKGFFVLDSTTNIKYEVTKDIQWDNVDGEWKEHVNLIETTVTDARLFGSSADAFAGVQLAGSDYAKAPDTYSGDVQTAKSYARSQNFLSHVLIDDVALTSPGEAFLNVWRNFGYFTFRPGNNSATKITILAGCQFPTYNALLTGAKEAYVTTEDVTFVKDANGNWLKDEGLKSYTVSFVVDGSTYSTQEVASGETVSKPTDPTKAASEDYTYTFDGWYLGGSAYDFATPVTQNITLVAKFKAVLKAGERETSISAISFARDGESNVMLITLSEKDYPLPSEVYNIPITEARFEDLNLYDKIIVDGYTLRARLEKQSSTYDDAIAARINKWQADCIGFKIPGVEGALDGAQKVTIRAGARFPSYAYATEGVAGYFVTTEEITFVNVGKDNGEWERQYRATFVADGEVVSNVAYLKSQGLVAPEVPAVEGYNGAWEAYTLDGDITINAVYTEKPTVKGTTSIKKMRRIDNNSNILIIEPSNSDYPASVEGYWNLGIDASHLQKFNLLDYITVNGKTLRELNVSSTAINKFTRPGLGLETVLSDSMTIVIKKGCEIPSYEFWQNPNGEASCYIVDGDYTCVYNAGGEDAFTISVDNTVVEGFNDHYVFSDLYSEGYSRSEVYRDGIQSLVYGSNAFGHLTSKSFTVTFDFMFTEADYLNSLVVKLGTDGDEKYGGNQGQFGWGFFLLRGSDSAVTQNYCIQYFSATSKNYGDADSDGNIAVSELGNKSFVAGQTYRVTIGYSLDAKNGKVTTYVEIDGISSGVQTFTLGGDFLTFCEKANTIIFAVEGATAKAVVGDPGRNLNKEVANKVTLEGATSEEIYADSIILPELDLIKNNQIGKVFVGWTTDKANLSTLYPAGYELEVSGEVALYPVFVGFVMEDGASVRLNNGAGIRFTVLVDGASYDALSGKILETGTILAPTSYLKDRELTHELGKGYFISSPARTWSVAEGANRKFATAYTGISAEQYSRQFSARGYLKINYTSGVGYIYTGYSEENNSRSIYQVATMAKAAGEGSDTLNSYVNDVADLTIDDASKKAFKTAEAKGNYTVTATKLGTTHTIKVSEAVKAVTVNGERLVMGYNASILINGLLYELSGYTLSSDGKTIKFKIAVKDEDLSKSQYLRQLDSYLKRTDYSDIHYNYVKSLVDSAKDTINTSGDSSVWKDTYNYTVAKIESVKNAVQHDANKGSTTLAKPVLSKGLGYTVTWNVVEGADYYTVHDDNDYRDRVVVMAGEELVYKAEVVGNHNVYVVAHSYYEDYRSSQSNTVKTPEVKQVFSYKSMLDGLYKFNKTQMSTMGLSDLIGKCYEDKSDKKYFVYYNKDTGWSPYETMRTDWTSPEEFPAHAQRLKDMGNNVILVARDTLAEFKAGETWEGSRLKYVMDTAWSIGMKVLVCDEVIYKLSMSDNSGTGATSKSQVTTAINNSKGFAHYVTHPAFYGFSLDDEPYGKYIKALSYTISALDDACSALGVEDPFYLSCLFQAQGGDLLVEWYSTQSSLKSYYDKWLAIDGVDGQYIYVDIYTQHAMDQPTNRYNESFEVIYSDSYLGGKYRFYQAITAHTQNDGVLTEQDMYMSLLYAAAHNVAGYSWFCYFPITGETSGSMVGFDGKGYGNGIGNSAMTGYNYYNAAKIAGYQFELIQGLLDGYVWKTRSHNDSKNLLTTTLSNGSRTATCYVNADVDKMSGSVTVTASGSECYLVGYGIGTAGAPYQAVASGSSVTLAPGQAVICLE